MVMTPHLREGWGRCAVVIYLNNNENTSSRLSRLVKGMMLSSMARSARNPLKLGLLARRLSGRGSALEKAVLTIGLDCATVLDCRSSSDDTPAFGGSVLLTCEHARNTLPLGYSFKGQLYTGGGCGVGGEDGKDEDDGREKQQRQQLLEDSHWAYDPGALDFAEELTEVFLQW
jgi:hypothetical protein